ncbi:hypothetical protein MHYP_G00251830 [Metynnis hypsauchen]
MSLETKLWAQIEGEQAKSKTLKLIKWLQKKHLLKEKLKCTLCHHKMKMLSVTKKDQYICMREDDLEIPGEGRNGSLE